MRSFTRLIGVFVCGSVSVLTFGAGTAYASTRSGGQHGGHSSGVTLTNPGNQVSSAGEAVQLQVRATDSNRGALTYSASGLPSGLAINAATGSITGTPTSAAVSSVRVTAVDTVGGASATASFGWTVNAAYDVSYPQCGQVLPAAPETSIVGVNDGIVFSSNPCLSSEAAWGQGHGLQLYANTGDPGPAYSSHWPTGGQASPENCTTGAQNATACSYDYGYNAAVNSFQDAAAQTANPASATWWLDVETGNSWETLESGYGQSAPYQANDVAALQGEVAGLQSEGVTTVGFYSTSYQWGQITGGTGSTFGADPAWLAGYTSQSQAQSGCASTSFTGGPVTFTQYQSNGLDADYPCT